LLCIYDNLDYTNSYFDDLLNNSVIKSKLKEQIMRNFSFLNKSFFYKIVNELKRVNYKLSQFLTRKRDLIRNSQIRRENYKTNVYLRAIKNLTNYNKKPFSNINSMNYNIPNDFKVFETDDDFVSNKDSYNKSQFYSVLQKIYKNYDHLYAPLQSILGLI
jgi:hypothetical protein